MSVVDRSFDHPQKLEEHAAMSLAGGLMGNGYQCGMLWGATLAAGAQAYRLHGPGPQAEADAVHAAQRLVAAFRARNKHINCLEITEFEMKPSAKNPSLTQMLKFFIKGGPVTCFSMAAAYAKTAYSEINSVYSENHRESPCSPVSCAAMLVRKAGLTEEHAIMAAGLAGGIGLSGGACGALGAAIWIIGMKSGMENVKLNELYPPRAEDVVESFLKSADHEFECTEIVGRKFDNVHAHAEFIRAGGCAQIIETLALAC